MPFGVVQTETKGVRFFSEWTKNDRVNRVGYHISFVMSRIVASFCKRKLFWFEVKSTKIDKCEHKTTSFVLSTLEINMKNVIFICYKCLFRTRTKLNGLQIAFIWIAYIWAWDSVHSSKPSRSYQCANLTMYYVWLKKRK